MNANACWDTRNLGTTVQISMNVNHQSPTVATSTLCVQIQKAHMYAAAKGDTKEMERFVKTLMNVHQGRQNAGLELTVLT